MSLPNRYLLNTVVLVGTAGCDTTPDKVDPGYYGQMTAAGRASVKVAETPAAPSSNVSSMVAQPPAAKPAASAPQKPAAESGGSPNATAASAPAKSSGASCDMSGRWLQTVHKTTDGLGNLQYSHVYWYYEIAQSGDAFTVEKSLFCGTGTVGGGAFAITVDFSGAAEGLRMHVNNDGRKGKSVAAAEGCSIELEKVYLVYGATLPHYLDPSTTLPTAEEPAAGGKPGWEDWDGDGNPGITGVCSGTVTGKIFTAPREWSSVSGTVSDISSVFKLAFNYDQEPNVMSFDGSPFLGSSAVRAADASLHFVQFARLTDGQATGDDAAICKSINQLAPMLTPEAAGM